MGGSTNWFDPIHGSDTKGGEALAEAAIEPLEYEPLSRTRPGWHVLWTHSHCEQLVYDQLAIKGFELLLPTIDAWSRRRGIQRLSRVPLFGSYLFLHHAMDKASYLEIRKTRGSSVSLGTAGIDWTPSRMAKSKPFRNSFVRGSRSFPIPISGGATGADHQRANWLMSKASSCGAT